MACDATTLLEEGKCYACMGEKQMAIAELALLCQLVEAGGGTGAAQQIYSGIAPPVTPDNPLLPAVFYPDGGGSLSQWDVDTQGWV